MDKCRYGSTCTYAEVQSWISDFRVTKIISNSIELEVISCELEIENSFLNFAIHYEIFPSFDICEKFVGGF